MPKTEVAVLTEDPILYAELTSMLRERSVPTMSLFPGERIPRGVRVVLTSEAEAVRIDFPNKVIARKGHTVDTWTLLQVARGVANMDEQFRVGIDPGPRPGFAIVTPQGHCIASGVLARPETAAVLARGLQETLPQAQLRFHVGNGDRVRQVRIVNELLRQHLSVEIVDERGSTPHGMRNNDAVSAFWIATQAGRSILRPLASTITPGEVREVQRRSRELSGGRLTIPRELALHVLEGDLSLEAAVRDASPGHPRASHLPLKHASK